MNPSELEARASQVVEVSWPDRWQVYRRLRELDVPCWCAIDEPLRVAIDTVTTAVQLQSVLKQFTSPRRDLLQWLERCWLAN